MNNKQLQKILASYPDDMPVRIMVNHSGRSIKDFDDENIVHTSETAYVDEDAPEDEWNLEDGKIELGSGQQYLLINPIIY